MTRPGRDAGCSAEHPDEARPDGEPVAEQRPRRRRGSHRRVVAPPTNPEADTFDDTAVPKEPAPGAAGESARDAWIRAQRPPHWG